MSSSLANGSRIVPVSSLLQTWPSGARATELISEARLFIPSRQFEGGVKVVWC